MKLTLILCGGNHGCGPSWYCVKIYLSRRSGVQQVEDDDAFCRLIYRFTVNKMIPKYQSGRKHELYERHDETSERGRGIVRYSN